MSATADVGIRKRASLLCARMPTLRPRTGFAAVISEVLQTSPALATKATTIPTPTPTKTTTPRTTTIT